MAAVAHLLSPTSGPAEPHLDGEAVKRQMFEALLGLWRRMPSPTVFVAEDIHWADPASIELLTHLLQLVEEVPIVFLCAFRPEREAPSWQVKVAAETHYPRAHIELDIDALSAEESSELFGNLLSVADLPDQVRETVLARADGNPLFVEEFTCALIDTGAATTHGGGAHWHADANVEQTAIPENLQACSPHA